MLSLEEKATILHLAGWSWVKANKHSTFHTYLHGEQIIYAIMWQHNEETTIEELYDYYMGQSHANN